MTKVRCTACRGAKQVMKLGAVMGDCNLCKGKGEINECDIPVVKVIPIEPVADAELISQVADFVPTTIEHKSELNTLSNVDKVVVDSISVADDTKVDGKRAIYKRKTIGK